MLEPQFRRFRSTFRIAFLALALAAGAGTPFTAHAAFPDIPVWAQSRSMNEAERQDFLERFTEHSRGVGFAVLGGAFGEGIDLPGKRLIGAFIATLGLPQVNPVNEEVKARMQQMFGAYRV